MSRYNQSLRDKIQKLLNETDVDLEDYTHVGVDNDSVGSVWLYEERPELEEFQDGVSVAFSVRANMAEYLGEVGSQVGLTLFHIGEFDLSSEPKIDYLYYYITYKATASGRHVDGYVIHRTPNPFFICRDVVNKICEDENVHKVILQNWIELTQEQFEIFDSEIEE